MINADSLPNKLTELRTRLEHDVNPDIIVISEVKPKNHRYPMTKADFKLDGYDTFKCNIDHKVGRGMIISTKPNIYASQRTSTSEFSDHLIIRIPLRGKDVVTLVGAYKSLDKSGENEVALHNLLWDI